MKNKRFTQLLCTLLAVLMLIGALPINAFAKSGEEMAETGLTYNELYFEDSMNWGNIYAYFWDDLLGEYSAWPGIPCENVGGNIWHTSVPQEYTYIIFNNYYGEQTDDLPIPGTGYIAKLTGNEVLGSYNYVNEAVWYEYDPSYIPDTTAAEVYATGDEYVYSSSFESPHNYTNYYDYTWVISRSGADSISLKFSSSTRTESSYDYIYIYSGNTQIGKYSGYELQGRTITVNGDYARVRLTSDGSNVYYGFKADITANYPEVETTYGYYDPTEADTTYGYYEPTQVVTTNATDPSEIITTPATDPYDEATADEWVTGSSFESPHNYYNNYDKTWGVRRSGAQSISLEFSSATKVENRYDKIYIYRGNDLYGTYIGTELAGRTITIAGEVVKVRLVSDSSQTYYGFKANISAYYGYNTDPTEIITTVAPTYAPLDVSISADYNERTGYLKLTATATGGTGNYQYKFYGEDSGSTDSFETYYGSSNTYTDYIYPADSSYYWYVKCTVSDGNDTAYDYDYLYIEFETTAADIETTAVATEPVYPALSLSLDADFNEQTGKIKLTATASGGTGNYQYKFTGGGYDYWYNYTDNFSSSYQSSNTYTYYVTDPDIEYWYLECTVSDGKNTKTQGEELSGSYTPPTEVSTTVPEIVVTEPTESTVPQYETLQEMLDATKVGDVITYTYLMRSPSGMSYIIFGTAYSPETLELIYEPDSVRFPNLNNVEVVQDTGAIAAGVTDSSKSYDFSEGKVLVQLKFRVIADGDKDISSTIYDAISYWGTVYIDDGVIYNIGVQTMDSATFESASDSTTVVPETEITTVPETEPEWSFDDLPEVGYNRYYFYMPESWYNEYATYPCIYWWEGTDACGAWPGHKAFKTDVPGVYYYDVNKDVTTIIWNNGIDGGTDDTQDIYTLAYQTKNIGSEYYDVEESPNYPYGTNSFDKMIYVIDESKTEINDFSGKSTYAGEWYYYYGNGEYGLTPEKGEVYFTDRTYFENPTPVYNDSSEETTVPFEEGMARIYCGDKYYDVNVGDTVTYTVNLKTPNKIEQIKGYFEYGNELKVISDSSSWAPNISTMVCSDTGTIMYFNASDIAKGFDFTEEKVLLNVSFTVVKEGEIRLNLCIEGMVEFFGGDYVLDGEILDDGVCLNESLTVTAAEVTIPETTAPKDLLLGDADLDKAVKIKDATAIQKYSANMISLSEDGLLCADVTADGKVNVKDATAIQKFLANIDTGYDINTYISGGSSGNDNPDYEEPEITDDIPDTDKPALSSKLYFKIPSDWKNFSTIYCHIYDEDGNALSNWHSKKEKCTQENGSIYSFDSTRVGGLEAGVTYFVVVSSDIGSESEHIELTDSSFENPIILTTEQDSVIVEPEIPDDNNDTISYCDICYDSVSSPYYYDGYQLCYDCYYDMKYDTTSYCDICNDSVSSPYYYDGYELCYSCYYDMKYDSSSSCDNCGKSVTDTYSYGGQKLCYNCYNLISNSVMCDMCRKFVSITYKHNGHDLCYDCYYERAYDNCENCGAAVSDPQYYNGYKLCYSCYNNMKNHSCDECGKYVSSPYSYNGQSLCYSCYTDMIPHYEKCSICGSPSVYQVVMGAYGGATYYCYSCYYNRY